MTRRISFGCALVAPLIAVCSSLACQQTFVLDDLSRDGGSSGTGTGGVGPSDASTPSDAHCSGTLSINYTPDKPQILVALDRSSEMGASFGGIGGESQFQAALDAVQTYVSRYTGGRNISPSIQFAFLAFPDLSSSCNAGTGCCASEVTSNYSDFAYANTCSGPTPNNCFPWSTRPTAAALYTALDYYNLPSGSSAQHGNERYVLLISDDDPQGSCTDSSSTCGDALTAVKGLTDIGVATEVVAIGAGALCLSQLATEQPVIPSPYFTASTPPDLSSQIETIIEAIALNSCRLTLTSLPASGHLSVSFNNFPQTQDSGMTGNGWSYSVDSNSNMRVYLHGNLCTMFLQSLLQGTQNGPSGLQISDGCSQQHPSGNP